MSSELEDLLSVVGRVPVPGLLLGGSEVRELSHRPDDLELQMELCQMLPLRIPELLGNLIPSLFCGSGPVMCGKRRFAFWKQPVEYHNLVNLK